MRSKLLNLAFKSRPSFHHSFSWLSKECGAPGHGQAKGTSVPRQKNDMNCPRTMCMVMIRHDLIRFVWHLLTLEEFRLFQIIQNPVARDSLLQTDRMIDVSWLNSAVLIAKGRHGTWRSSRQNDRVTGLIVSSFRFAQHADMFSSLVSIFSSQPNPCQELGAAAPSWCQRVSCQDYTTPRQQRYT